MARRVLSGGGARARKKARRMPTTVAAIENSFRRLSERKAPWRTKFSVEDASWERGGHTRKYKAEILPDTITPGRTCVFFVTKARGDLSPALERSPFGATSLCKGGTSLTEYRTFPSRSQAEIYVITAAARNRARRRGR